MRKANRSLIRGLPVNILDQVQSSLGWTMHGPCSQGPIGPDGPRTRLLVLLIQGLGMDQVMVRRSMFFMFCFSATDRS